MKKVFLIVTLALMTVASARAAENIYQVKVGVFNPEATETGFILGGLAGVEIDERIDVGVSLDWYRKTFEESTIVYDDDNGSNGTDIGVTVPNFESSVTMIPLMANVRLKIPLGRDFEQPLLPYLQGGLGYVMSWYGYDNYDTGDAETEFYGGFGLRLAVGAMYQIGSASRVTLEVYYQSASLEREEDDPEIGRPVISELDMSGMGITIGLQFGGSSI